MTPEVWVAMFSALSVLLLVTRDVLCLWIKLHYRVQNGANGKTPDAPDSPGL